MNVAYRFTYTAREFDKAGLLYFRARYYNPQIGRFISEDPIGQAEQISLYLYVSGSPINLEDPMGLCYFDVRCRPSGAKDLLHCYIMAISGGGGGASFVVEELHAGPVGGMLGSWVSTGDLIKENFKKDCKICQEAVDCKKIECLEKRTRDINGKFAYVPKGPNSNSFVWNVLRDCGLPQPVAPAGATGWNCPLN